MTTGSAIREPSGRCLRCVVLSFGIRLRSAYPRKNKHSQKRSTFHYFWNHFLPFHSCASLPSLNDTLAVAWVAARHLLVGFPLAFFKLSCTFFETFRNLSGQSTAKHLFPETRFPMPNPTRVPGSLGVTLPRSSVTCPSELPQAGERFHLKKNGDSLFCTICSDFHRITAAPGNHSRRNLCGHHRNRVSHRINPTFARFLSATRHEKSLLFFFGGLSHFTTVA